MIVAEEGGEEVVAIAVFVMVVRPVVAAAVAAVVGDSLVIAGVAVESSAIAGE